MAGYKVTLRYQGRSLTVPFFCGPAITDEPSAADVVSCLISDGCSGEQSFEEFCREFGEDPDSRKAEAAWKACAKTATRIRRFLGADYDEFAGASH